MRFNSLEELNQHISSLQFDQEQLKESKVIREKFDALGLKKQRAVYGEQMFVNPQYATIITLDAAGQVVDTLADFQHPVQDKDVDTIKELSKLPTRPTLVIKEKDSYYLKLECEIVKMVKTLCEIVDLNSLDADDVWLIDISRSAKILITHNNMFLGSLATTSDDYQHAVKNGQINYTDKYSILHNPGRFHCPITSKLTLQVYKGKFEKGEEIFNSKGDFKRGKLGIKGIMQRLYAGQGEELGAEYFEKKTQGAVAKFEGQLKSIKVDKSLPYVVEGYNLQNEFTFLYCKDDKYFTQYNEIEFTRQTVDELPVNITKAFNCLDENESVLGYISESNLDAVRNLDSLQEGCYYYFNDDYWSRKLVTIIKTKDQVKANSFKIYKETIESTRFEQDIQLCKNGTYHYSNCRDILSYCDFDKLIALDKSVDSCKEICDTYIADKVKERQEKERKEEEERIAREEQQKREQEERERKEKEEYDNSYAEIQQKAQDLIDEIGEINWLYRKRENDKIVPNKITKISTRSSTYALEDLVNKKYNLGSYEMQTVSSVLDKYTKMIEEIKNQPYKYHVLMDSPTYCEHMQDLSDFQRNHLFTNKAHILTWYSDMFEAESYRKLESYIDNADNYKYEYLYPAIKQGINNAYNLWREEVEKNNPQPISIIQKKKSTITVASMDELKQDLKDNLDTIVQWSPELNLEMQKSIVQQFLDGKTLSSKQEYRLKQVIERLKAKTHKDYK